MAVESRCGEATELVRIHGYPWRRPATRIEEFDRPTLVVASASSPELATQKAMAAQIKDARFVSIAETGHGVFVDQPERFNRALREFLAGLEP